MAALDLSFFSMFLFLLLYSIFISQWVSLPNSVRPPFAFLPRPADLPQLPQTQAKAPPPPHPKPTWQASAPPNSNTANNPLPKATLRPLPLPPATHPPPPDTPLNNPPPNAAPTQDPPPKAPVVPQGTPLPQVLLLAP